MATSELRRARDETSTLADDMIAMAEKSSRDEEHIAALQAALREAQARQAPHACPCSLDISQQSPRAHSQPGASSVFRPAPAGQALTGSSETVCDSEGC